MVWMRECGRPVAFLSGARGRAEVRDDLVEQAGHTFDALDRMLGEAAGGAEPGKAEGEPGEDEGDSDR